jgi:hypothetical protein
VKKILTGCLIVAVIAMIGMGVAGYYAYRLARPMLENAGDYMARAREMSQLGDRIANKAPFVPPRNGELTAAQVDRFLAVQGRVRDELDDRWAEIETRSAEIRKQTEDYSRVLSFSEVSSIFSELANTYIEARRVQVNALNIQGAQKPQIRKLPDMPIPEVPPANIKLVKPHITKLKESVPMAVLGL